MIGSPNTFGRTLEVNANSEILVKHTDAIPITDNAGSITVDGTVTINAIPAGNNNIGDVDIASLPSVVLTAETTKVIGVVRTADGTGGLTSSISSASINNLAVAQGATNYHVSSANSSSAQITAGNTFIGTVETAFNQQSYSILMVSDQNMTLTFRDYIDSGGTQLAGSTVFTVLANAGFKYVFSKVYSCPWGQVFFRV